MFDTLYTLTNRPRFTDQGERIRGSGVNIGRLRYARAVDHSLADWWYDQDAGVLQLWLPWPILNVSDPSSRQVRFESDPLQPGPDVTGTIPARDAYGNWPLTRSTTWAWAEWETPTWHVYLKAAYYDLQRLWAAP